VDPRRYLSSHLKSVGFSVCSCFDAIILLLQFGIIFNNLSAIRAWLKLFFCQLLVAKDLETVLALSSTVSANSNDRAPLATALLQIFRHEHQEAHLLKTLNDLDIDNEGKVAALPVLRLLGMQQFCSGCLLSDVGREMFYDSPVESGVL
jgi:hypothetical protein